MKNHIIIINSNWTQLKWAIDAKPINNMKLPHMDKFEESNEQTNCLP